jgi:Sulfotransferase domain
MTMLKDIGARYVRVLWRRVASVYVRSIGKITARTRARPDFIIIGAQKAGTTSLYNYIAQHPQVLPAEKKEIHYFDHFYQNGEFWYRSHFPHNRTLKRKGAVTGEGSPFYLFHPLCAERISAIPDVKLIVLLRNPVERAISHYFMQVRKGHETLPIDMAMRNEESRIATEVEKLERYPYYRSYPLAHFSYKSRGIYADQLKRYLDNFSRERLLVVKAEDLFSRTNNVLKEVYGFLGIDQSFLPPDLGLRNVGKNKEPVPSEVYKYLTDYFRPHNERLSRMLGKDLNW